MIKLEFILTWTSLAAETLLRMHLKARTSFNDWFWNIRKTGLLHDINKPTITTWLNWRMETDSTEGWKLTRMPGWQKVVAVDDKSSLKWDYSRRSIYTMHYLNNRQILLLCFCHLIHRKGCKKKEEKKLHDKLTN